MNSISFGTAKARVAAGKDIYTWWNARAVAAVSAVGLGSIGPEIDKNRKAGKLYYMHYHTGNRNGSHAFFGLPFTK